MATRKRTTKRLYRQLKRAQADDAPIPAPTLFGIKFYIKYHGRSEQILIEDDLEFEVFPALPPAAHPSKFILSQLEAQKIANFSRPSNQVLAVLVVTSKFLAQDPLDPQSYPTLFTWYNPDNHRTYCLFAYLDCLMDSRIYRASELLELRSSYSPDNVLDTIKSDSEIADIVKIAKNSGNSNGNNNSVNAPLTQPRRLKKAKEDVSSSAESEDHVLFKGKKQGIETNGVSEWKYRGRSGSEITSNEPLSAPVGLDAQQSEGFQRFFKAVVSPTHVRVTAGGRIVPNTRANTSPTTKWDKNRAEHETRESIDTTKNNKPEVENEAKSNMLPPAGSHVLQNHPAFFQHPGLPIPLIPMHNGVPLTYGFPHSQSTASNATQPASSNVQSEPGKIALVAQTDDGIDTNKSQQGPVKLSPPNQFDHTKPFFFNGHFVYPAMGAAHMQGQTPTFIPNPYLPPNMIGNPAALAAARMAHMGHIPPAMPLFGHPGFIPSPYGASSASGTSHPVQQPPHQAKLVPPPISSIRPSEITKQQINQLRSAVKYYEDQLLYNKHQIDEKSTREQVHDIKAKIHQFEYDHKMQEAFESLYYPKSTQNSETVVAVPTQETPPPCNTPSQTSSINENRLDDVSRDGSIRSGNQAPPFIQKQLSHRPHSRPKGFVNRSAVGINAFNNDNNSSAALDALTAHIKRQMKLEEEEKKRSIPSGAALAPPFHPGTKALALGDGQNESQPRHADEYSNYQGQHGGTCPQNQRASWDTTQSTNAYLANDSTLADTQTSTRAFAPSSYSAPYLVGTLPQGINPYTARGIDYVYARELTDEEIRARHIYWGQVSTKGTGLPKFDGKDFYPPSPVKADEKRSRLHTGNPGGRPEIDISFQLSSTENDPFRSSREGARTRSQESTHKVSRAIPIVNPDSVGRGDNSKAPFISPGPSPHENRDLKGDLGDMPLSPGSRAEYGSERCDNEKETALLNRRAIERSSNKSGHDLWQTMMKKGSTSGTALPSAISSATATGYLPQYFGHAAASLSPAISHAASPPSRVASGADSKPSEFESCVAQGRGDKLGENRPPREAPVPESDATKEIHKRMLRDAERRGVIGPGWQ